MKTLQKLVFVLIIAEACLGLKKRPADYHVASDMQLVMREDDGGVKFGLDSGNVFRAEVRAPNDDVVRGVYSFITPGSQIPLTFAYKGDSSAGYQRVSFNDLGFVLPPYPYSLKQNDDEIDFGEGLRAYGALAQRNRKIGAPLVYFG